VHVKALAALGSLSALLCLLFFASTARAQSKVEQQARVLQKRAIEEDYLATEFSKAEERLNGAVALCGVDKCSAQLRAQLQRDLGVVEIGGQIDRQKGMAHFVEAVRIDPAIALDPDVRTKELEQAFNQARARAGVGAARNAPPPVQRPPDQPSPSQPPPDQKDVANAQLDDCPPGSPCAAKAAAAAGHKFPRFWIGAGVGFEFLLLPAGQDVCKLNSDGPNKYSPVNDAGYYCTNPDGSDYPPRNDTTLAENKKLIDGKAGNVVQGVSPSNFRVWLSFDYALSANFLIGARIGLVLRTFPGSEPQKDGHVLLAPFHGEARLTYLAGRNAIMQTAAPYFFVASGVSQFDAKVEAPVLETGDPQPRSIQAWEIAGPWFASLGAGVRVVFGDQKNLALLLGGRGNLTLPVAKSPVVPSFGPELNFQIGF